ncbi:MAG: hypothetical protein MJB57_11265, partial [Gemmatimonadetes bacterium]|nr:hypothetical protein [Gemmatimonadota bacterium]
MRVPAKDERRGRSLELSALVEALSDPAPYPHRVDAVEVRHTHISVVFLTDRLVYKIKKPVELGFLDFTTLERRRWFCEEEVRLNRRLAPDVYLGIVPIVRYEGALLVDPRGPAASAGEVVEWAVLMSRLPEAHTLASWVRDGSLRPYHVTVLARRLASFHADAARGPSISAWGTFETVAGNARENLAQSLPHVGCTLSAQVHGRVSRALDRELERLEPVISGRAGRGVPCDTHGDLHLDHVYVFADRAPPDDIVIVDCIEFN